MDPLAHLTAAAALVASGTAFAVLAVRAINDGLDRRATRRRIRRRLMAFPR